jgi:hypothetical protein
MCMKTMHVRMVMPVCLAVYFMSRIAGRILIKSDVKFMPLEVTPHLILANFLQLVI